MSNPNDFVIENGVLKKYVGPGGDVVVPESVTEIGIGAFYACRSLKSIELPESVTSIGNSAFSGCHCLTSIVIPESVTSIGDCAFQRCWDLKSVSIPEGPTHIGSEAFSACWKLADASGRIIVKDTLFGYSGDSRSLTIPAQVRCVSEGALKDCGELDALIADPDTFSQAWRQLNPANKQRVALSQLQSGTISPEVKAYARRSREKLAAEMIRRDDPAALELLLSIGKAPDLGALERYVSDAAGSVNVQAWLLDYKASHFTPEQSEALHEDRQEKALGMRERTLKDWKEIFKFSVKDDGIHIATYLQNDSVVTIPETMEGHPVTVISDGAFKSKTALEEIALPLGLKWIGSRAFQGCTALKHIRIPEAVDRILDYVFDGCTALESVEMSGAVTLILDYAFRDCKSMAYILMPEKLTELGYGAFTNCKSLTEISLSDGLKKIEHYAFRGCTKLIRLRIPASAKDIPSDAVSGCKKLTICAPAGSRAATVARANKLPFAVE